MAEWIFSVKLNRVSNYTEKGTQDIYWSIENIVLCSSQAPESKSKINWHSNRNSALPGCCKRDRRTRSDEAQSDSESKAAKFHFDLILPDIHTRWLTWWYVHSVYVPVEPNQSPPNGPIDSDTFAHGMLCLPSGEEKSTHGIFFAFVFFPLFYTSIFLLPCLVSYTHTFSEKELRIQTNQNTGQIKLQRNDRSEERATPTKNRMKRSALESQWKFEGKQPARQVGSWSFVACKMNDYYNSIVRIMDEMAIVNWFWVLDEMNF